MARSRSPPPAPRATVPRAPLIGTMSSSCIVRRHASDDVAPRPRPRTVTRSAPRESAHPHAHVPASRPRPLACSCESCSAPPAPGSRGRGRAHTTGGYLVAHGAEFVYTADDNSNPSTDAAFPGWVFPQAGPGMFAAMLRKLMCAPLVWISPPLHPRHLPHLLARSIPARSPRLPNPPRPHAASRGQPASSFTSRSEALRRRYPDLMHRVHCLGKGGNEGTHYMMEAGIQKLIAQGCPPPHFRTAAPPHPRTLAPSHPRTLAPSHPRTLAPSHPTPPGPPAVTRASAHAS
jgi:hypothetical protein